MPISFPSNPITGQTYTDGNKTFTYNGKGWTTSIASVALTTANISEQNNLYFTNARSYSNVTAIGFATNANVNLKANIADLTTSNVLEVNNLYFTNARSRQALTAGTGVTYDNSTGTISIGQNVDTHSSVTFGNVTVTGNLTVQGNAIVFESNTLVINDPLIQVGRNPVGDSIDLGFFGHYIGGTPSIERHAGLFRDASDGQFKLFANLDPEPVNVVDTSNTSYQSANLVVNFIVGKVTDISNHSTTNLSEGTNLYFTNARVYSNVVAAGFYDTVSNTAPINASESGTTLTLSHATSGVSAATYGGAATVPVYVVNDTGHITSASNVAIAIASGAVSGLAASATTDTTNATNITSGTLGAARLPNSGVVAGTYGGLDWYIPVVAVDSYGRVTSASNIIAPYSIVNASEVSGGVNLRQRLVINNAGYLAAEANIKLASGSGISITRNNDSEIFITTAGDSNFSNVSANNQFIKINNLGSVSGATTINLTLGNMITATATGAVQWTVTGLQGTSNYGSIFLLELTNGGVGTQTWMSGIKWPSGTAPTLQASGVDVLAFFTDDNGTTWRGVLNMSNSS